MYKHIYTPEGEGGREVCVCVVLVKGVGRVAIVFGIIRVGVVGATRGDKETALRGSSFSGQWGAS